MCEQCGGPLILLGALGQRLWFRCRDCGWDQSAWEEDIDLDWEDEDDD